MSSKDTTRQKLVGSMRKTKAAAGIGGVTTNGKPEVAGSKVSASVKPAQRKASISTSSESTEEVGIKGYQSGRRVWPD